MINRTNRQDVKKRVNLTIPIADALRIRKEVARRGTRISEFVLAAVNAYLQKPAKPAPQE
jgi:hypothetical protein